MTLKQFEEVETRLRKMGYAPKPKEDLRDESVKAFDKLNAMAKKSHPLPGDK